MTGEKDLMTLLASLEPDLLKEEFVFCTSKDMTLLVAAKLEPLAFFQEPEGLSLVLVKSAASEAGFDVSSVFKCITLTVHSSLEAVGLTAAVAEKLSIHGVSANVVAAFYHDHVFVPEAKAALALQLLQEFRG